MSVASLSNITAMLQRKTLTTDAVGGAVETWANQGNYQIALQPITGTEANRYDREEFDVTNKAYVAGKPDIVLGDRFSIDGNTYLIHAVLNPCSLDRHLEMHLEREI